VTCICLAFSRKHRNARISQLPVHLSANPQGRVQLARSLNLTMFFVLSNRILFLGRVKLSADDMRVTRTSCEDVGAEREGGLSAPVVAQVFIAHVTAL